MGSQIFRIVMSAELLKILLVNTPGLEFQTLSGCVNLYIDLQVFTSLFFIFGKSNRNIMIIFFPILYAKFLNHVKLVSWTGLCCDNHDSYWCMLSFLYTSVFLLGFCDLIMWKSFGKMEHGFIHKRETCYLWIGHDAAKVKEQLKSLKSILGAFMLRRTKSKLIECGNLVLPPLTEITMYAFCPVLPN